MRQDHYDEYLDDKQDGFKVLRMECIRGDIRYRREMEAIRRKLEAAALEQIKWYKYGAYAETFLMSKEDGWGGDIEGLIIEFQKHGELTPEGCFQELLDFCPPRKWSAAKTLTTRNSKNKDIKVWKLLGKQEQSQCDDFLDMWGAWRAKNSVFTLLKISRQHYNRQHYNIM